MVCQPDVSVNHHPAHLPDFWKSSRVCGAPLQSVFTSGSSTLMHTSVLSEGRSELNLNTQDKARQASLTPPGVAVTKKWVKESRTGNEYPGELCVDVIGWDHEAQVLPASHRHIEEER